MGLLSFQPENVNNKDQLDYSWSLVLIHPSLPPSPRTLCLALPAFPAPPVCPGSCLIAAACIGDIILSVMAQSSELTFRLISYFTTTDGDIVLITAAAAPIHLSISRSILPLLKNP